MAPKNQPKTETATKSPSNKRSVSKPSEGEKKHRRTDRATLNARKFQNPAHRPKNFYYKAPFIRDIRAVMQKAHGTDNGYRFTPRALALIQSYIEGKQLKHLKAGALCTANANKTTLTVAHLENAHKIQVIAC